MFYVFNVHKWLDEVVSACFENQLDPEDSVFALLMFSSLDFEFRYPDITLRENVRF